MARPKKQGLDYFTKNVNFYQDIKIRKLIRHKGIQAVSVYDILLCQIYAAGYYLKWDDDLPFFIAEISDLEEGYISGVIDYALSINLFDKGVYDECGVLTSRGIQERFFDFCSIAKRKVSGPLPYLLVDIRGKIVSSEETVVSSEETGVSSEKIKRVVPPKEAGQTVVSSEEVEQAVVFSEETGVSSEETPINSVKSTQSKVKKSKVYNNTTTTITRTHACDSLDSEIEEMKNSPIWIESILMKYRLDESRLFELLEGFSTDCRCNGISSHSDITDAKSHFNNWLRIQNDYGRKNRNDNHQGNLREQAAGLIARMQAEDDSAL